MMCVCVCVCVRVCVRVCVWYRTSTSTSTSTSTYCVHTVIHVRNTEFFRISSSQFSAFLIQQGTLFQQLTQQLIAPTATLNVLTAIKFEFL